ncbi:MAG: hypothetical protein KDE58_10560 [Caldilineaceae bacterium]|nr:hypothetical protein [Caldilineaceae bacterium]
MLLTDTIHHYEPFEQLYAHCRLRIYQHNEQVIVIVTEMADNREIAVTNYWPELAYEIADQYGLTPTTTIWLEHYPQGNYALASARGDTFDQLTLAAERPQWRRLTHEEIEQLIGEPLANDKSFR